MGPIWHACSGDQSVGVVSGAHQWNVEASGRDICGHHQALRIGLETVDRAKSSALLRREPEMTTT